jgi:hypothetical protein
MTITTPELDKKPGISYAVTNDGLELPVIDVTHRAFAIHTSESEIEALLQEHIRSVEREGKLGKLIQPLVLRLLSRRSIVMRGLLASKGGFLTGLNTYILKLGPDNMGKGYASDIDRVISRSISGLSVRLRLQNVSYLLADGLQPLLSAAPDQPLHLLNIGGGPAIDSLNALIILKKRRTDLLARGSIFIHILDLDESGPSFGGRALQALQAQGAPLSGLNITFQHVAYNWSDTSPLLELLRSLEPGSIVAASSEGALFEYGSDEDVTSNLRTLRDNTPSNAIVVGSVTRADSTGRLMNSGSGAALQFRGVEAFLALAQAASWTLKKRLDRPSGHDIYLQKAEK